MRYKFQTGYFAWLIHRITGVSLTFYIFVHLYVLSNLRDPSKYESMMGLMKNPIFRLSEVGLLALVVIHALNGVRLTLIDMGVPTRFQKTLFKSAVTVGGMIFVVGSWLIMWGAD